MDSKKEEQRKIRHVIDGDPPVEVIGGRMTPAKGVTILSRNGDETGTEKAKPERGVEIHDPRHG